MNLTYLCYGMRQMYAKKIKRNTDFSYFWIKRN